MSKIIVIAGGSDGVGKEVALSLTSNNKVIILSKNREKVEKIAKELKSDFEVCDVRNYSEIDRAIKSIVQKYSRIDVLINCAGLYLKGKIEDNTPQQIQDVYSVNTLGTVYLIKAVAPVMKDQKDGQIINMITQGGLPGFGKAERSIYYSSKMAITSFTKSISLELLPFGIRVTGVYPGMIDTKFMEKQGVNLDMGTAVSSKNVSQIICAVINTDPTVHIPEIGIKSIKQIS